MKLEDIIIFENNNFIVVDKPQGVVSNKSLTQKKSTVAHMAEDYLNLKLPKTLAKLSDDAKEFYERNGLVHRLDKDTSGVLIIARNPKSYISLKKVFLKRKVIKEYHAVVFNDITKFFNGKKTLKINLPILRSKQDRQKFVVGEGGREAISEVNLLNKFENATIPNPVALFDSTFFSLIKVFPKTGRTHQIRVHLKAVNCEILGDSLYNGRAQKKFNEKQNVRLCLIAKKISFKAFGKSYTFESKYNQNFRKIVEVLYKI